MALKTGEKDSASLDTVTLELAMYTHYTWGGVTYEKGTAYKFKREDAITLLGEQDHGRPIWRQYLPPKPKGTPRMPLVDSTEVRAVRQRVSLEEAAGRSLPAPGKRIDVGSEEEIADILNRPDDESGNITV